MIFCITIITGNVKQNKTKKTNSSISLRPLCGIWLLPLLKFLGCHGLYSAIKLGERINVSTKRSLASFKITHFKLFYLCPYSTLSLICLPSKCFHSYPNIISSLTPTYLLYCLLSSPGLLIFLLNLLYLVSSQLIS